MTLFAVAVMLTVMHALAMTLWFNDALPLVDEWWQFAFFDLDEEESFGTWFSVGILLIAGQLLLLKTRLARRQNDRWWRWWLVLSLGFHFLSLDEVAGFHEFVNTVVESTPWTTFGAAIAGVLALTYTPFLLALPGRTRLLFIISGAIYVGGAVGVERATDWYVLNDQLNTLPYNLWTAIEEFMEMTGVILFIYALLNYLGEKELQVELNFKT
jgi:hypothetical protein